MIGLASVVVLTVGTLMLVYQPPIDGEMVGYLRAFGWCWISCGLLLAVLAVVVA